MPVRLRAKTAEALAAVREIRRAGLAPSTLAWKSPAAAPAAGRPPLQSALLARGLVPAAAVRLCGVHAASRCMSSSAPQPQHKQQQKQQQVDEHDEHDEMDEDDRKISSPHISWKEKSKIIFKKYGTVALVFHSSVFLATLGGIYWGMTHGVAVEKLLSCVPWLEAKPDLSGVPGYTKLGTLGLAYGMTLTTGPVRTILTIVATPPIGRAIFGKKRRKKADQAHSLTQQSQQGQQQGQEQQRSKF